MNPLGLLRDLELGDRGVRHSPGQWSHSSRRPQSEFCLRAQIPKAGISRHAFENIPTQTMEQPEAGEAGCCEDGNQRAIEDKPEGA